jgi:hypothetical protein
MSTATPTPLAKESVPSTASTPTTSTNESEGKGPACCPPGAPGFVPAGPWINKGWIFHLLNLFLSSHRVMMT